MTKLEKIAYTIATMTTIWAIWSTYSLDCSMDRLETRIQDFNHMVSTSRIELSKRN